MSLEYPYTHRFNHLLKISDPQERIALNTMQIEANAQIGAAGEHLSEAQRKNAFEVFAKAFFDSISASQKRQQFQNKEIARGILERELKDLFKPNKGEMK